MNTIDTTRHRVKTAAVGDQDTSPAFVGNCLGLICLSILIALFGWIESTNPGGLRFRDLTGGLVTFDTLVRIGILTIVVTGLNLLMGYAGQISLGQAAFYGLGAYVSGIMTTLSTRHGLLSSVSTTWWWPWLAMLVGMVVTGGFAYLIGRPILRLRGNYLAMATLGLGIVVYIIFREAGGATGGNDGLAGIPRLSLGKGLPLWPMERYYYLVWAVAIAIVAVSLNVVNSRIGRALRALHDNEVAASTLGVDVQHYKLQMLVVSAMFASLAGSLYAHFQALVAPSPFNFQASVELVVMATVGGIGSVWGAPLGVAVILVVREMLRARLHVLLHMAGGEHEMVAYGVILIIIVIFMPEGLASGLAGMVRYARRLTNRADGLSRHASAGSGTGTTS
jgi:branched-chain amino acid transport system permease protein